MLAIREEVTQSVTDPLNSKIDVVVRGMEDRLSSQKREIDDLKAELSDLRSLCFSLQDQVERVEGQDRRNNLRFSGVVESPRENWAQTEDKVRGLLYDMGMEQVSIERAHRVGPFREGHNRQILVKFSYFKAREWILNNRGRLRSTGVFVSEDFTDRVRAVRGKLWASAKAAGYESQSLSLRFKTLRINKTPYKLAHDGKFSIPVDGEGPCFPVPPRKTASPHASGTAPHLSPRLLRHPVGGDESSHGHDRRETDQQMDDGEDTTPTASPAAGERGAVGGHSFMPPPPPFTADQRKSKNSMPPGIRRRTRSASRQERSASHSQPHYTPHHHPYLPLRQPLLNPASLSQTRRDNAANNMGRGGRH